MYVLKLAIFLLFLISKSLLPNSVLASDDEEYCEEGISTSNSSISNDEEVYDEEAHEEAIFEEEEFYEEANEAASRQISQPLSFPSFSSSPIWTQNSFSVPPFNNVDSPNPEFIFGAATHTTSEVIEDLSLKNSRQGGWSLMAEEVKVHILTFLRDNTSNRKFLNYRLVNKNFNALLHSIPCTLTLHQLGGMPEQFDNLKNLLQFKIEGLILKNFQDKEIIFDSIRLQLPNLKVLDLCECPGLSTNMLYYVSKLPNLEELRLQGQRTTDEAVQYIANLNHLRSLSVRDSNIYINVFEKLTCNQFLQIVDLSKSGKSGGTYLNQDLMHVHRFPFLTGLNLSGNCVTDIALQHLSNITSLKSLLLADTDITDQGLEHIGAIPLEELNLSRTRITVEGFLQRVSRFSQLRILSLDYIHMSHIRLSTLLMPLSYLEDVYLRYTGMPITTILQYYEDVSGIKQNELVGYNVVLHPKSKVTEESAFFKEIQNVDDIKKVYMQKIPITHEILKIFYEQQITRVKIFV
jgi:Leucine-rich repeat (LRR) protein